ncbi:MAG: signal recognition particle protein [Dehalococcoidia bacterium]|nr:signal recognition particle protein [Dehalococcoidia bacterium]
MFDSLTEKLTGVFSRLTNRGRLTDKDVDEALREVRLALLEADVNLRVARELVDRVRARALDGQVLQSLSPGQQVVKIVYEELAAILGQGHQGLTPSPQAPSVILLMGLQGSGKTTTAAKLALYLRRQGLRPMLVAADLRRPAAIEQLATLGKQLDIPVYQEGTDSTAVQVATHGLERARTLGSTWAIVDTGGRLHIDDDLMQELEQVKAATSPSESLLVVDAMTGQDAVRAAQEFHQRIGLTGLILSKLDGDARGGAALSIAHVTGVPVKFVGTGERPEALEPFHPDRMASRILGMGDVATLVERAQQEMDEKQAKELERKMRRATFDMEDFLQQLQQLRRMGSLTQVLEMIPGLSSVARKLPADAMDERRIKRVEAIILSMTPQERRHPDMLNGSRKRRIAKGSGSTPQEVNQLLNQFKQTQKLMQQMASGKGMRGLGGLLR